MDYMPSATKGAVLTSTSEILPTPASAELINLFNRSLKVGLNFGKIFDFEEGDSGEKESQEQHEEREKARTTHSHSLCAVDKPTNDKSFGNSRIVECVPQNSQFSCVKNTYMTNPISSP